MTTNPHVSRRVTTIPPQPAAAPAAAVPGAMPGAVPGAPSGTAPRIASLDVVRGLALCGILVTNMLTVARVGTATDPGPMTLGDAHAWVELLLRQRFFPVFALLFGIGFALLLESATRRGAARPRAVLLRRLLLLLPLGVAHAFVHPGEVLSTYAVLGLVVLLPSSWLPRWLVAVGGALGVTAALVWFEGGLPLIPGLFLVGSALVRYGVVQRCARPTLRVTLPVLAVLLAATVPALLWHASEIERSYSSHSSGIAGLLLGATYVTATLALLATRAAPVVTAVLAPLGRTALTCYVTATPLMLLAGLLLDLPHAETLTGVLVVAVVILAGQWALATWWLRRHAQGPLEALWRRGTWWGVRTGRGPAGAVPAA